MADLKRMNIIFAINIPYPLGMAGTARVKLFANYIARNHITSVLVTNQANGENQDQGIINNVFYSLLVPSWTPIYLRLALYPFFSFIRLFQLKRHDKKNVICIYGNIDLYFLPILIAARFLGYKVIQDIVEDQSLKSEEFSLLTRLNIGFAVLFEPLFMRWLHGVIVISSQIEEKIQSINSSIPKLLIPVSATNLSFNFLSDKEKSDLITIFYCGSFGVKDGVELLLEAFVRSQKVHPNLRLTLVGTPSNDVLKKIQIIQNNTINITGYLNDDDYWKCLYSSDILCMTRIDSPYANAGFPFKLGEYLATGKPVLATNVGDVTKYLEHQKDAIIIKPSCIDAIEEGINYLVSHPETHQLIGQNGLEKAKQFFNPEINSKMFEQFAQKI
jgi:glycosyltransferase involved in cell wall biosynthesis